MKKGRNPTPPSLRRGGSIRVHSLFSILELRLRLGTLILTSNLSLRKRFHDRIYDFVD